VLQESLSIAARTGAAKPSIGQGDRRHDPAKTIAFPTDARLMHRARLVRSPKSTVSHGANFMRTSAKWRSLSDNATRTTSSSSGRSDHCRSLKTLTTFLGRVIGDIARGIEDKEALENLFAHPFMLACRVLARTRISAALGTLPRQTGGFSACTRRRLNASARARRTRLMNLA
jgi:hypothetical protein